MKIKQVVGRALLPVQQQAFRNVHDLKNLFVELTARCNIACLHCGSDCHRESDQKDLPQKVILNALEEIKSKYDSHKIMVILSGGEPLLYPGVFDLGKKIIELEFPWGMVTNGFGWDSKKIRQAKRAHLHSITVSLDGPKAEHNWLRGNGKSFSRAVETIKMLVADPFYKEMDVVTCVNKKNLPKLEETFELVKSLGLKKWRLFIISPIGRAPKIPELFVDSDEFKELMEKVQSFRQRDEMQVNFSESGYLGPHYENTVRDQAYFCSAGVSTAGIMVNGDILACPNIDRRLSQGNIFEDSFVDTWENKYQQFRNRSWMKTGPCNGCKEWRQCQGNSMHSWDLDNDRPRLCHCEDFELI